MAPRSRTADTIVRVNIAILSICIPLLILCLLRGLWLPAAVFAFISFSNGYQLWSTKRPPDDPRGR
ncbi:MAG: hypothetical protein ABJH68_14590 [Ilumatobacter sp.]|uniref:hypothetical protein n=1 Tax=Ilumatobacter sp. TaxID=1967498 RepID=UPI0032973858